MTLSLCIGMPSISRSHADSCVRSQLSFLAEYRHLGVHWPELQIYHVDSFNTIYATHYSPQMMYHHRYLYFHLLLLLICNVNASDDIVENVMFSSNDREVLTVNTYTISKRHGRRSLLSTPSARTDEPTGISTTTLITRAQRLFSLIWFLIYQTTSFPMYRYKVNWFGSYLFERIRLCFLKVLQSRFQCNISMREDFDSFMIDFCFTVHAAGRLSCCWKFEFIFEKHSSFSHFQQLFVQHLIMTSLTV